MRTPANPKLLKTYMYPEMYPHTPLSLSNSHLRKNSNVPILRRISDVSILRRVSDAIS